MNDGIYVDAPGYAECAELRLQLADVRATIGQAMALMCEDKCSRNCCSHAARALLASTLATGKDGGQ